MQPNLPVVLLMTSLVFEGLTSVFHTLLKQVPLKMLKFDEPLMNP